MDNDTLLLSPFVTLELQHLYEVGKINVPAKAVIDDLAPKLELVICDPPSALICEVAATLDWTRDPFDRLISAQAAAPDTPLITKDRIIRMNHSQAWLP